MRPDGQPSAALQEGSDLPIGGLGTVSHSDAIQMAHQLLREAIQQGMGEAQMISTASSIEPPGTPFLAPPSAPDLRRSFQWLPLVISTSTFVGFLIITYVMRQLLRDERMNPSSNITLTRVLRSCFVDRAKEAKMSIDSKAAPSDNLEEPLIVSAARLIFCVTGIFTCYIWYGVLQERVITQRYGEDQTLFNDTSILVFIGRVVAVILATVCIFIQHTLFPGTKVPHTVPLYKYSFSAYTNNISTLAQYEILKYVSFPLQVLGKASKVPPVMLMEFILRGRVYTYIQYSLGVIIVFGTVTFQAFSDHVPDDSSIDSLPTEYKALGICLLIVYIVFDSFTSNWQHKIFVDHSVDWVQMSLWSSIFGMIIGGVGVFTSPELPVVAELVRQDGSLALIVFFLALSSAVGNCFIFYTIKSFGPVVYATIATVRQLISIIISIDTFHHVINAQQIVSIVLVFVAILVPLVPRLSQEARRKEAALARDAQLHSSKENMTGRWWLCTCAAKDGLLLPSGSCETTAANGWWLTRVYKSCFELVASQRMVRVTIIICLLVTINLTKAVMSESVFVQLDVPVAFSFFTSVLALLVLTFAMGLRPHTFSYPIKADAPMLGACSVLVAGELVCIYVAVQRLPYNIFLLFRAFDVLTTGTLESIYLRYRPQYVTIVLLVLLSVASFLYALELDYIKVDGLGLVMACLSLFCTPIKRVSLRTSFRNLNQRMSIEAFIYWTELFAVVMLLVWSLINHQLIDFFNNQQQLTSIQSVVVAIAGLLGGTRIILDVLLLTQASATTASVVESFTNALVGVVVLLAWGRYAQGDHLDVAQARSRGQHDIRPLRGLNIGGLALLLLAHICFAYYHMMNPDAYAPYPPIDGEQNQHATKAQAKKLEASTVEHGADDPRGRARKPAMDPRGVPAMAVVDATQVEVGHGAKQL